MAQLFCFCMARQGRVINGRNGLRGDSLYLLKVEMCRCLSERRLEEKEENCRKRENGWWKQRTFLLSYYYYFGRRCIYFYLSFYSIFFILETVQTDWWCIYVRREKINEAEHQLWRSKWQNIVEKNRPDRKWATFTLSIVAWVDNQPARYCCNVNGPEQRRRISTINGDNLKLST